MSPQIIAAAALLIGVTIHPLAPDTVVVQSDRGTITHARIRCPELLRDQPAQCLAAEQRLLETRVHELAIDAAGARHVRLTSDDQTEISRKVSDTAALGRRAATEYQQIARAWLQVQRGDSYESVIEELTRSGIKRANIEMTFANIRTIHDAEKILSRDHIAETREAANRYYTREKVRARLASIVRKRAAESGKSFEDEASALWRDVLSAERFRLVTDRYVMPDFKGVLNENAAD